MASPYNQNYAYQAYQSPAQPYSVRADELHIDTSHGQQFPRRHHNSPPPPPVHRVPVAMQGDSQTQGHRPYGSQNYSDFSPPGTSSQAASPHITPGADNLGEAAAGGGISGIAEGVANANERESGVQAMRDVENWGRNGAGDPRAAAASPPGRPDTSATPFADHYGYDNPAAPRPIHHSNLSYASNVPLAAGAFAPASVVTSSNSERSLPLDTRPSPPESIAMYDPNPYHRYSTTELNLAPQQLGAINPLDADDDDDWGMGPQPPRTSIQQKRRSFVPFSASRDSSQEEFPTGSGTALAAGAGATAGATAYAAHDASGSYNPVPGGSGASGVSGGSGGLPDLRAEKAMWLAEEKKKRKRTTWIVGTIIVLVCIGAIVGGIAGTQIHKGGSNESQKQAAEAVENDNKDDLSINSSEIKKLMGNKDFHKVFPGIDYTPLNAQYPDCMHAGPSQNNITRDMAVMSQLTNAVRLYGTDCNQTQMVLHAIERLELTDMKVWLGVWIGNNETTNARQIKHMYEILDEYKQEPFKGIIVGNEVLYREDKTKAELLDILSDVRSNLTEKKIDLKVAMADLGDNWTSDMTHEVDIVMSNVHPFFSGTTAEDSAGWTWSFWQNNDVALTADDLSIQQIIAEVGWPTAGGNNCGGRDCATKTEGSVASIDNLNRFMEDWVCPSLKNGTEYFWFEAFDEPWKIAFNEPGKEWEDKWGLMDVNRKLKPGVKIPDCGSLNLR